MSLPWTESRPQDEEALHRQFDEQQVIERSVLGTLSPAEQEIFEEHFLTCDRCLSQLEASQRLHTALKGVAVEEVARQQRLGWLARRAVSWRRLTARPGTFAGLGLVLVLVTAAMVWWRLDADRQALRQQLELAMAPPNRTFIVPLDATRSSSGNGGTAGQILELGAGPEWIVLTLPAGETEQASFDRTFSVSLEDAQGKILWQRQGLRMGNDGRIVFGLPSVALAAGRHEVILRPEAGSAEARRFPVSIQFIDRRGLAPRRSP